MKSPFKFLDAFTLRDKDSFFGRDQEIDALYTMVFKTPMVLVYGLSGTGKTSIIQCGLASRFDGPDWYPVFIRRNNNINNSVSMVMRNALGNLARDTLAENVSLLLRKTLRPVYLLFDQFEELFILGREEEQKIFMESLRELLDAQLPSKIVLIMREEYIAQLYNYETLIPELFDHRFRVEPMGPAKVKNVISSSFAKFNIHLAEPKEELLDAMVRNINDPRTGITLPYLQVYLDMLYRDKYKKQYGQGEAEGYPRLDINASDIASLGRIDNVLERFLDNQTREIRSELVQKYKTIKPDVIQQVLDVFVSEEGTKKPVGFTQSGNDILLEEETAALLKDIPNPMLTEILNILQQDRILRRGDDHIELAHDSLALVIDSRRTESQRQLQSIKKRLTNAYEEFQETGAFLNQKQLAAFDEYRPQLGLSDEMEAFLNKCEQEVERQVAEDRDRLQQENRMAEQKKLARTRKTWLVIASVLAGAAIFLALRFKMQGVSLADEKAQSERLRQETDSLYTKLVYDSDSIKNVITQSDMLISKLDTMADSEKNVNNIELSKVVMSLKGLIRNETISDAEMAKRYITLKDIFLTGKIAKGAILAKAKRDTVFQSPVVNLVLQVKTPKKKLDFIEIKWAKFPGEIIGAPIYVNVKPLNLISDSLQWLSVPVILEDEGSYEVTIANSSGRQIGHATFQRGEGSNPANPTNETPTYNKNELSVIEFRTMASGNMKSQGPEQDHFFTGGMIHYYIRLYCPIGGESIAVQLLDDQDKIVWSDKYTTAINTSETGFRLWRYHGARSTGNYTMRLIKNDGAELGKKRIVIDSEGMQ